MNSKAFSRFFPILLTVLALWMGTGCSNSGGLPSDLVNNPNTADGKGDPGNLPVIKFEENDHDFGKIYEGESVSYDFKFTNSGKSELIIAEVSSSCGCTVPSYPKTPIRPGESGVIKVMFNSKGKLGYQSKSVLVAANTQPNTTILRIKAEVVNPGKD